MRIGLITYHWVANFGANLQALATTQFLRQQGHEVFLLDYRPPELVTKYANTIAPQQLAAHEHFCSTMLPQTEVCPNLESVKRIASELSLDVALTGSDAVFRLSRRLLREDTTFPNPFWLGWAQQMDLPTASVAASAMGTNFLTLPGADRRGVAHALKRMDYVSVRDTWTALMVSAVTGGRCRPALLPDPVFTLRPPKASDITERPQQPYVILSGQPHLFDRAWTDRFVAAARRVGLRVVALPTPEGQLPAGVVDDVAKLPLCPLDWYNWIAGAAGYVGVRFHPIVVAMANQVPFVSVDLYQRRRSLPWASKTFDMTFRAGLSRRCFSPRRFRRLSPATVLERMLAQTDAYGPRAHAFATKAQEGYAALNRWLAQLNAGAPDKRQTTISAAPEPDTRRGLSARAGSPTDQPMP